MKMFTVIIPVYHSTKLEKALASIENQSVKDDIELIIVADDGDGARYQALLNNYTVTSSVIVNETNLGPGMARQVGLDAAKGEWVTFLDHDDEFAFDCFAIVKQRILQDKPTMIVASNIMTANDYNWPINHAYSVNDGIGTLHGKFYNVEKLRYYNIHFSSELRTQEDTFFISIMEAHIYLDRDNLGENFEIFVPNITYYWYLWPDSTSHKGENDASITFVYLEKYFKEYIDACYKSILEVQSVYPHDKEYLEIKFVTLFFFCYWFMEFFYHMNEETEERGRHTDLIQDNIIYIRELMASAITLLGLKNKYQMEQVMRKYGFIYGQVSRTLMANNFQEDIIPLHDLKTFYTQII